MSGCDNCACGPPTVTGGGGCCPPPSNPSRSTLRVSISPSAGGDGGGCRPQQSSAAASAAPETRGRRSSLPPAGPQRPSGRGAGRASVSSGGRGRRRDRLSLSSRILICILVVYVISIAVMILVPASQGLLIYCHWIKIPMFRDLEDLVSFRIPHGRNIQVTTIDGVQLKGWHLLPAGEMGREASRLHTDGVGLEDYFDEALARDGARIVIYFHGNAATRGQWNRVELIKALSATMASHVIAVDYRGFGDSKGWPTEEGLMLDAEAIWKWVLEKTGGPRSQKRAKIYLYGHSLGTGVAVKLASYLEAHGHYGTPAGLILDAPFTNLTSAALHHPSALPFRILPFIRSALASSIKDAFPSMRLIGDVTAPLLVLHGRNDRMIPFHLGEELYQRAKMERLMKTPHLLEDLWFAEFPTAGHNDIYAYPQWVKEVAAFMQAMEISRPVPAEEAAAETCA